MSVEALASAQTLPQPRMVGFRDLSPEVAALINEQTHVLDSENPDIRVYDFEDRGDTAYAIFVGDPKGEAEITVVDVDRRGKEEGFGTVERDSSLPKGSSRRMPYVSYIETHEDYLRQGLAERRLRILNTLSWEIFGQPIHSELEDFTSEEGDKLVRSLAARGMAEAFRDNDEQRWRAAS